MKQILCGLAFAVATLSTANAEWRQYEGIYTIGFESEVFADCGNGIFGWVELIDGAADALVGFDNVQSDSMTGNDRNPLTEVPDQMFKDVPTYFIVGEAWLHPPGEYGHMGGSKRKYTFRMLDEIRYPTPEDYERCR